MTGRSGPPDRVPTLTEVVEPGAGAVVASAPGAVEAPVAAPGEPDTAQRLMTDLQIHIDRVLDARVRAALEPVLQQVIARVTEETRRELASTLRDGIARALAQESSRHRGGSAPR